MVASARGLERSWGSGTPEVEDVVATALRVIDADGLERCTTRRLAAELGVHQTALYRRLRSRDVLLDLVADAVLAEVAWPTASPDDWQDWLVEHAVATRSALLRHPAAAVLVNTASTLQPTSLRHAEQVLAVLENAGFSGEPLLLAYQAYMRYVVGGSIVEAMPRPKESEPGVQAELDPTQVSENPRVASLRSMLHESRERGDAHELAERLFSEGLRLLLGGLASRLGSPSAR